MATREKLYAEQLQTLGIYDPAFDPEIHTLAMLERELQRTLKAWKATAPNKQTPPSPLDPLYAVICSLRKEILQHRDALGLTPKGLRRLKNAGIVPDIPPSAQGAAAPLSKLLDRLKASAAGETAAVDWEQDRDAGLLTDET